MCRFDDTSSREECAVMVDPVFYLSDIEDAT